MNRVKTSRDNSTTYVSASLESTPGFIICAVVLSSLQRQCLYRDNGCSSIVLIPLCLKGSVVTSETCAEEISKLVLGS